MPRKEMLKERLREESIWIMLIIFFGFTTLWSTLNLGKELRFLMFGVKVEAVIPEKSSFAKYVAHTGEEYKVDATVMITDISDGKVTLYYLEDNPAEAICMTHWKWWIVSLGMPLAITVWAIYMLYSNFRKRRMIRQKTKFDKRNVSGKELGEILLDCWTNHNKDLYEKHVDNLRAETLVYKKIYDDFKEVAMDIIEEQEKIWKVGTVYLGCVYEDTMKNGVVNMAYTDNMKYIKNPDLFYEMIMSKELDTANVYISKALVDMDKLPYDGTANKYYLVLSKPGLTKYALLLPEWYYYKEEIETM